MSSSGLGAKRAGAKTAATHKDRRCKTTVIPSIPYTKTTACCTACFSAQSCPLIPNSNLRKPAKAALKKGDGGHHTEIKGLWLKASAGVSHTALSVTRLWRGWRHVLSTRMSHCCPSTILCSNLDWKRVSRKSRPASSAPFMVIWIDISTDTELDTVVSPVRLP